MGRPLIPPLDIGLDDDNGILLDEARDSPAYFQHLLEIVLW